MRTCLPKTGRESSVFETLPKACFQFRCIDAFEPHLELIAPGNADSMRVAIVDTDDHPIGTDGADAAPNRGN